MNFPTVINDNEKDSQNKNIDFAAILTGREVPRVYTLDTALATFQSCNKNNGNYDDQDLKYSVKTTDMEKIKEVSIDIGKSSGEEEIVIELYKSSSPSNEVMGNIVEGNINSKELKGSLHGKDAKALVKKIEEGKAYVNISTEDNPKGKLRGQIKKLNFQVECWTI